MSPLRISLFLVLSLVFIILISKVEESESVYAYAIKGIVKDVRLHPTRFIGGWFFKKAFILKKLKLKWHIKKKLILKKLLKKLLFIGRRKRAVRFPEDNAGEQISTNTNFNRFQQVQQSDDYIQQHNIGSLGLSQNDMDQYKRLPDNLKYEYGREMERLHAAASEPKEEEIQDYLSMATEFDGGSCIPRSICEIMARGNRTTNQFESQILEYYSSEPEALERKTGTPSYVYDYAANLGKSSRDIRTCGQNFQSCSVSTHALNSFMNEVFTPEMCDSSSSVFANLHDHI